MSDKIKVRVRYDSEHTCFVFAVDARGLYGYASSKYLINALKDAQVPDYLQLSIIERVRADQKYQEFEFNI